MEHSPLEGVRILLVEDSYDTQESIRIWLKQNGADVTCAATAEEGLELLPRVRPHVLLCDIGLPGEDGYALLRKVRSLDAQHGGLTPAAAIAACTRAHRVSYSSLANAFSKPLGRRGPCSSALAALPPKPAMDANSAELADDFRKLRLSTEPASRSPSPAFLLMGRGSAQRRH